MGFRHAGLASRFGRHAGSCELEFLQGFSEVMCPELTKTELLHVGIGQVSGGGSRRLPNCPDDQIDEEQCLFVDVLDY